MPNKFIKNYVAGIDEAGRGPLCGPVTAACVVLKPGYSNPLIRDSKTLTHKERECAFNEIRENSLAYSIISVGPRRIDLLNIRQATRVAMASAAERVFQKLQSADSKVNVYFLLDGNVPMATERPQEAIIKGDQKIVSIAAASILAKVARDRLMETLDKRFPGYGFAIHKGYPTKAHREKIAVLGPTSAHRRTFAGVKEFLSTHD